MKRDEFTDLLPPDEEPSDLVPPFHAPDRPYSDGNSYPVPSLAQLMLLPVDELLELTCPKATRTEQPAHVFEEARPQAKLEVIEMECEWCAKPFNYTRGSRTCSRKCRENVAASRPDQDSRIAAMMYDQLRKIAKKEGCW